MFINQWLSSSKIPIPAIKFTNYNKQITILFIIYADTECFLKKTEVREGEHTTKCQEYIPNSIAAKLVCIDVISIYYMGTR